MAILLPRADYPTPGSAPIARETPARRARRPQTEAPRAARQNPPMNNTDSRAGDRARMTLMRSTGK